MARLGIPFEWTSGAIWLLPDGTIHVIPGFHDEWIRTHQALVPACLNVTDVILKKHWVSIVTYAKDYVEVMIDSRNNESSVQTVLHYLGLNLEKWDSILLMSMQEDYYEKITVEEFNNMAKLKDKIMGKE